MATIKSKEKTKKPSSTKTNKKPSTANKKKTVDPKFVDSNSELTPITPQLEEKLTKSFRTIEGYLKGMAYSTPILIIFSLYWVFQSDGSLTTIVNFLSSIPLSIGIIFSYRLFSKQSKKSLLAYSITFGVTILSTILSYGILSLRQFNLTDVLIYIFGTAILIDIFRLKKYDYLF